MDGKDGKKEEGGSSAYVPPDPKDDVQLQLAYELICGTKTDAKPSRRSPASCRRNARRSPRRPSRAKKSTAN